MLKDVLMGILKKEELNIVFPNIKMNIAEVVEMECYKTLQKIKAVIENDSLSDEECFMKIEKIICIFEEIGSNGGNRHDFG